MAPKKPNGPTKRCSRCKQLKPLKEFGKNRATADGLAAYCKPCKRKSETQHSPGAALFEGVSQPGKKSDTGTPPPAAPSSALKDLPPAMPADATPLRDGSMISQQLIETIAGVLRKAHTRTAAARHAGIDEDTLAQWMHRGRDAKPGTPTRLMFEAVLAAEAEAEITLVEEIKTEGAFDPRLKFKLLERRFPDWARRDHLEVTDNRAGLAEADSLKTQLLEKAKKLLTTLAGGPPPGAAAPAAKPGDPGVGNAPA